ncbi:MAG TPA: class I SAM-dependent methyltransferase [Calditrichia bacterium]|nr:class I SAM-dependent methyltransferase [Calditrichia bacterium]
MFPLTPRLRFAAGILKRLLVYRHYDASTYWRRRAGEKGGARVLWQNETYNDCFRIVQREWLQRLIPLSDRPIRLLDIGCGIGEVAAMVAGLGGNLQIDGVDFPEMVAVARRENPHPGVSYIEGSAESYRPQENLYDLILSSACYSAIRDPAKLHRALQNGVEMLKPGGKLILIDPFHAWRFLARTRKSSGEVTRFMRNRGLKRTLKSGVLFWPYREWLANSDTEKGTLKARFQTGEIWLGRLGKHLWADYKILVFELPDNGHPGNHS